MNELHIVGQIVAESSEKLVRNLVADPQLTHIVTGSDAEVAIDAVVRQDPVPNSKRIWAVVFSVATAILAVPEIQAMMGATWMPVATALLAAVAALWSKATDPRPTR